MFIQPVKRDTAGVKNVLAKIFLKILYRIWQKYFFKNLDRNYNI
jgi:hypothetical protein